MCRCSCICLYTRIRECCWCQCWCQCWCWQLQHSQGQHSQGRAIACQLVFSYACVHAHVHVHARARACACSRSVPSSVQMWLLVSGVVRAVLRLAGCDDGAADGLEVDAGAVAQIAGYNASRVALEWKGKGAARIEWGKVK